MSEVYSEIKRESYHLEGFKAEEELILEVPEEFNNSKEEVLVSDWIMGKKRSCRSANFTIEEVKVLVNLAGKRKAILENKRTDSASWAEKDKAWESLGKEFSQLLGPGRHWKLLRSKYDSLKKVVRRKTRMELSKSGEAPSLNEMEEKIRGMIFLSLEGQESRFDSDCIETLGESNTDESSSSQRPYHPSEGESNTGESSSSQHLPQASEGFKGFEAEEELILEVPEVFMNSKEEVLAFDWSNKRSRRSANFTVEEVKVLINLAGKRKDILESKQNDSVIWEEKAKAWESLGEEFSKLLGPGRHWKTLRAKYDNLKKGVRRKTRIALSNSKSRDAPSEMQERRMILLSLEGEESWCDTDFIELPGTEKDFKSSNKGKLACCESNTSSSQRPPQASEGESNAEETSSSQRLPHASEDFIAVKSGEELIPEVPELFMNRKEEVLVSEWLMDQKRKRRSANFTVEEVKVLISLAEKRKDILDSKRTDSASWDEKTRAWESLGEEFSQLLGPGRHWKTLRAKYDNLKKEGRRKTRIALSNSKSRDAPSEMQERRMILLSLEGEESWCDTDFIELPGTGNADENNLFPSTPSSPPQRNEILREIGESNTEEISSSQRPPQASEDQAETSEDCNLRRQSDQQHPTLRRRKEKNKSKKLTEAQLELLHLQQRLATQELQHKKELFELEKQKLLVELEISKRRLMKMNEGD